MCLKLIIFVFLTIFGNFSSAQTTCSFQFVGVTNRYTCRLENQNIRNENDMNTIGGNHMENRGDSNVVQLDHTTSVVNVFPSQIIDHFANIQFVNLLGVEMRVMDRPITNCERLFSVDISRNEIRQLPAGIFENCRMLNTIQINNNQISSIHIDAFSGLSRLSSLWLTRNNIASVNRNIFRHTPTLGGIFLHDNEIEEFSADVTHDLPNLHWLGLRNNRLTTWTIDILRRNPRLQRLNLDGNRIQTLNADVFSNLPNLVELSIGGLFTEIPTFTGVERLETFVMQNCQITRVSADSFVNMVNVWSLSLTHNQITTVDFSTKDVLPRLTHINLFNNSISDLGESSFEMFEGRDNGLSSLVISRNQIERLPFDVFQPVISSLRTLDVNRNRISSIDRRIVQQSSNLRLDLFGNQCASGLFEINDQFDSNRLNRCFNSGINLKINSIILVFAVLVGILNKF